MGPNVMEFLWAKRREGMWMEFEATDSLPDITQVGIQNEHEPSKTLGDNRGKSYTNDSFLRLEIYTNQDIYHYAHTKRCIVCFSLISITDVIRGIFAEGGWRKLLIALVLLI